MNPPFTIPDDEPLLDVHRHLGWTGRRLRANALTQALAPRFEDLLSTLMTVHQKDLDLEAKVDDAYMEVVIEDAVLNAFAQQTSAAALVITGNDREDALYHHLFRGQTVSAFNKPILSKQLAKMHDWVSPLQNSEHPALQELGAKLPDLLKKADAAATARAEAEQERREFREVGERKKFIDEVNAARKETFGTLAMMPHKYPGLPPRFAESFFRKSDRARRSSEPDVESVKARIEALKKELEEQEQLLVKLEKEEADAKAAVEERTRAEAATKLAEVEKVIEAKQKEAAAIKAALGGAK